MNCWIKWVVVCCGFTVSVAFAATQILPAPASCKKVCKNNEKEKHEQKKKKSPWQGTNAQLGYVVSTGNVNSANLSAGVNVLYNQPKWGNTFQANAYLNKSLGVTTKEQYFVTNQFNYYFNGARTNYIFSNLRFIDDRFSPYEYQVVFASGYGRDIIKIEHFTLSAQVGPGIRHSYIRATRLYENNLILTTALMMNWQITNKMAFSEQLDYDIGKPFDYLKSVTALTATLAGHLAAQLSYTVQYYSIIPLGNPNTKKTDTITNIALVYNF